MLTANKDILRSIFIQSLHRSKQHNAGDNTPAQTIEDEGPADAGRVHPLVMRLAAPTTHRQQHE